jgi:hypothetical protein
MENKDVFSAMGFALEGTSTHNSRTIMFNELDTLLQYMNASGMKKADYFHAIIEDNCLGKRSGVTRQISAEHLSNLYTLDPGYVIFSAMLYFWRRDVSGRPLLALLCAYSRDYVLHELVPFILELPQGAAVSKTVLEEYLENKIPGVFSQATLESSIRNVASSLTKTGHLTGRTQKIRAKAKATAGSVSYALFLGYLKGERGILLFKTNFARILDCPFEEMVELAEAASRAGWIVFKHIEKYIEVLFPNQLVGNPNE